MIIKEKTEAVMADLAQVKPAVEDARQGKDSCVRLESVWFNVALCVKSSRLLT